MSPHTPLFYPWTYFERNDRPSLRLAAGVVIANAVLFSLSLGWVFSDILARADLPPRVDDAAQGALLNAVVGVFFKLLIGWLILAVIFHIVVWIADGKKGFGATLAVVGIAELVSLVLLPLEIAVLFYVLGDVPVNPTTELSSGFRPAAVLQNSTFLFITGLITGLWRIYLISAGLSRVHDIRYKIIGVVTFVIVMIGVLGSSV